MFKIVVFPLFLDNTQNMNPIIDDIFTSSHEQTNTFHNLNLNFNAFGSSGSSEPIKNNNTNKSFDNFQFAGNTENVPLKPINPMQQPSKDASFQPPVTQVLNIFFTRIIIDSFFYI